MSDKNSASLGQKAPVPFSLVYSDEVSRLGCEHYFDLSVGGTKGRDSNFPMSTRQQQILTGSWSDCLSCSDCLRRSGTMTSSSILV